MLTKRNSKERSDVSSSRIQAESVAVSARLVAAALCGSFIVSAHARPAPDQVHKEPTLTVTLRPDAPNAAGDIEWVDVGVDVSAVQIDAGAPLLRIPLVYASVSSVADGLDGFRVMDDAGSVQLQSRDDQPGVGAHLYWRHWVASRIVSGRLVVRYRAPIRLAIPRLGGGPPFDLRSDGGGIVGAGNTFLVLPESEQRYRILLRWDLSRLAPGSTGASSLGDGDVTTIGTVDNANNSYYMAGPLHRFPPDRPTDRNFRAAWLTNPPFDAPQLLTLIAKDYDALAVFFKSTLPSYRVFLRGNPYDGKGGAGLFQSFLMSYPQNRDISAWLRLTLVHEMVHAFVGSLDETLGNGLWFSEGMAVTYQRRIPLRVGSITPERFLKDLNQTAVRYYTNQLNQVPDDEITARFWKDSRIRNLPYDRGSLYLATVDAEVRRSSQGGRSLDDLLLAMLDLRKAGKSMDTKAWLNLVTRELGSAAETEWKAMMEGKIMVPPSDAFGPCFARTAVKMRQFDLGFDQAILTQPTRIIKGLRADSAAAIAGLNDGDEILQPVQLEDIQADEAKQVTLSIRHGEEKREVTYLPRGKEVEGYLWARVSGVPDSACAL